MIPYVIYLIVVLLLAFIAYRRSKPRYVFVVLLYIVMSLFAGFRSSIVGTDTGEYAIEYEEQYYTDYDLGHGISVLTEEPAFYYLQKWLGQLSNEYYVLLIGIAIVFCFFVVISIEKNSLSPVLSLFVFITLGYYTFVFNAARQAIAMAIYMTSIPFLHKKRFWEYSLIVLCAALFHKTIIIAIPLFFIFTMKFSHKSVIIAIVGGLIIAYALPVLLDYGASLEARYALYKEGRATGGLLLTLFYTILTVFFAVEKKNIRVEYRKAYDVFLNMLMIGSAIYLIVSITGAYVELTRFAAYFQISTVFLWPILLKASKRPVNKLIVALALIGHIGFFAIYLSKMANLTPYIFNPSIINVLL